MKPPQIIIFLSFLLCSASLCKAQSAGTFSGLRLQASSTWADNLNRSSHIPSVKSGQFYTASGTLDYSRQLNRNWIIIAEGEVVTNIVKKYSGLNSLSGTGKAKIRRKFGLGAYAPIFEASVGATVSSFKETARNGTQLEAGLRVSKRLTHALQFSGGINWEDFNARHRTYDVRTHRVFLEGNWDVTDRWRLSAGATRIWGQFVASAAGAVWPLALNGQLGPEVFQHYNTLAWEVSDTFGPGWVAYRNRESQVDQWWVEISPALTDRTSLSLRYEFNKSINAIGIRYDAIFWTLGLNHQF